MWRPWCGGSPEQTILDLLRECATEAEVHDLAAHDFRRNLIGNLLYAGAEIVIVQQLPATFRDDRRSTRRRGDGTKQIAARLFHIPTPDERDGSTAR
jgi:hypothetical protein